VLGKDLLEWEVGSGPPGTGYKMTVDNSEWCRCMNWFLHMGLSARCSDFDVFDKIRVKLYKERCAAFMTQWRAKYGDRTPVRLALLKKAEKYKRWLAGYSS